MKKIAAWTCLLIYLNAAAQLLLPWVFDGLAHVFFWQDHLEHVHHGQVHSHHVGVEMGAQTDDAHSRSSAGHLLFSSEDVLSAHFVSTSVLMLPFMGVEGISLNARWSFNYQSISPDIFLPPPDQAI